MASEDASIAQPCPVEVGAGHSARPRGSVTSAPGRPGSDMRRGASAVASGIQRDRPSPGVAMLLPSSFACTWKRHGQLRRRRPRYEPRCVRRILVTAVLVAACSPPLPSFICATCRAEGQHLRACARAHRERRHRGGAGAVASSGEGGRADQRPLRGDRPLPEGAVPRCPGVDRCARPPVGRIRASRRRCCCTPGGSRCSRG